MGVLLDIIAIPFGWLMKLLYAITSNYGIALILFVIIERIFFFPSNYKNRKAAIKQAAFKPLINEIQQRYAGDKERQTEELTRLQEENDFVMNNGCLSTIIQMPIFMGLIRVIYRPLTYIVSISKEALAAATELVTELGYTISAESPQTTIIEAVKADATAFGEIFTQAEIESIINLDMTLFGIDLTRIPKITQPDIVWLIPAISVGMMVIGRFIIPLIRKQKMTPKAIGLNAMLTLMFVSFGFTLPAGVSLYFCVTSIISVIVNYVLSILLDPKKEIPKIRGEVEAAKLRMGLTSDGQRLNVEEMKEYNKKRLEKARALDAEKYPEDELTESEKEKLAKAREIDTQKYGS